MTVLVRPQVGQLTKACGVQFEKAALEAVLESIQLGFGQDVSIEATRGVKDSDFADAIKDVYGVLDIVDISKEAGLFTRIPGPSTKPEEVVAGVIAAFCSTVRREGVTEFHYEVSRNRADANKNVYGRVLMFAAESYSSTIRHKGFRALYEGAPFDVYTNITKWFYGI